MPPNLDYFFSLIQEIHIRVDHHFNAQSVNKNLPDLIRVLPAKFKHQRVTLFLTLYVLKLDSVFSEFMKSPNDFIFKKIRIEKHNTHGYCDVTCSTLEHMMKCKSVHFANIKFSGNPKGIGIPKIFDHSVDTI